MPRLVLATLAGMGIVCLADWLDWPTWSAYGLSALTGVGLGWRR